MRTWILTTLLLLSTPNVRAHNNQETPDHLPDVCHLIYQTKIEAERSCPPDILAIEVYDFWQKKFLGWGCDCSPVGGPLTPFR